MGKKAKTRTDTEIFRDAFSSAFGEDVEVIEGPEIDEKLLAPHKCSIHHRLQIEASKLCGCFSCLSTFPPAKIEYWTDDETRAWCPVCWIDSVIGDASGFPITKEFLSEMCEFWFGDLPKEGRSVEKPVVIDV